MSSNIRPTGFGSNVAEVRLHFAGTVARDGKVSVYVFHGAPSSDSWWRVREPVATFEEPIAAFEFIDRLCGEDFAYQAFPFYVWRDRDGWLLTHLDGGRAED